MAKVDSGNIAVPYTEENNYTQGKEGCGTPITAGPARGHVSGNPTKDGGINRGVQSFNTGLKKGGSRP